MNKNHSYASAHVFHERAVEYDSWYDDSLLFEIEKEALLAFASPGKKSLEIGVGPGRFAEVAGTNFGLDPALEPLRLAAGRGVLPCQGIASQLPFQTGVFTTLYLLFTLCFLGRDPTFFRECRRVLDKEGRLIIGFIPRESSWGQSLSAKKENGHPFYRYSDLWSVAELEHGLAQSGFTIDKGISTLYQPPDKLKVMEQPQEKIDEQAGLVIIEAIRNR